MRQKVVARYADGRMLKGHTANFDPAIRRFILAPADGGMTTGTASVDLTQLKAVFFVKDFAGVRGHVDRKTFPQDFPNQGRRVRVTFDDGEVIVGATPSYDPRKLGFFLFPADTGANTVKIFAVNAHVRQVEYL